MLERLPPVAVELDAGSNLAGRRLLFAVLFAATMAASLALAALALSPGGFARHARGSRCSITIWFMRSLTA